MAWRRGKVSSERYQTGPSYTNHPTCTPHVYTYIRRGVSFKRHAKGSGTEEKGMRRQDELVSFTGLVRRSSADGTDSFTSRLSSHTRTTCCPSLLLLPRGNQVSPEEEEENSLFVEKGGASMPPSRFHSKIHERVQFKFQAMKKRKEKI